jgi:hypothetical protein
MHHRNGGVHHQPFLGSLRPRLRPERTSEKTAYEKGSALIGSALTLFSDKKYWLHSLVSNGCERLKQCRILWLAFSRRRTFVVKKIEQLG